jgi:enterochelin esterase family protein
VAQEENHKKHASFVADHRMAIHRSKMKTIQVIKFIVAAMLAAFVLVPPGFSQPAPNLGTNAAAPGDRTARRNEGGVPRVEPVEVSADHHVTFRFRSAKAEAVRVNANDIPNFGNVVLTKGANEIWEATIGPVDPGEYRYVFMVDGQAVNPPRNPATPETATTSESNGNTWDLFYVPGLDFMDARNVPHGAIETVTYFSKALDRNRRMHVYLPPGYERGSKKYPILYLLHGAGDSDDAWSTVGRAGFILDNLIAANQARPMVVVMPAGHTSAGFGAGRGAAGAAPRDEFKEDFLGDIMPYAESHYRVYTDQRHRAIAGLSMGGGQTLEAAFTTGNQFAYIGVFSSGAGLGGGGANWETAHQAVLDNPKLKRGIKLIWFSTGQDDRLITRSLATVDLLKKHGFDPQFTQSPGAHTWINWRNYLNIFLPQLFE